MSRYTVTLLLIMMCWGLSNGQNAPFDVSQNSHVFLKQKALGAEREHDYLLAMTYYDKLKTIRPQNASYQWKHAYYSLINKDYAVAEKGLEKLYEDGIQDFETAFYLARTKKHLQKYDESIEILEKLKKDIQKTPEYKQVRKMMANELEGAYLAKRNQKVDNAFVVRPLNRSINSRQFEGSPVWINENQFIYASHKTIDLELFDKNKDETNIPNRAFYLANQSGDEWNSVKEFSAPYIRNEGNFGNAAFNPSRDKFFFSLCDKNDHHKIECELYWSILEDGSWSVPKKIEGEVNLKGYTATQPTMGYESMRGREVLYFVSDRPGGKGGMDIWYAILSDRANKFVSVGNAGSKINTAGDELTPYYHLEDSTLFFSSEGQAGLGGLDIFKTRGERVKWEEPVNIGIPFNSPADDLYFNPKKGLKEGFLVSNRVGSTPLYGATCCDDIFYFKYEEPVEFEAEITLIDELTGECMDGKEIQMFVHDKYTDDQFLINQFNQDRCSIKVPLNTDLVYSFKGNVEGKKSSEAIVDTRKLNSSKIFRDTIYLSPAPLEPSDPIAGTDLNRNRRSRNNPTNSNTQSNSNNNTSGPVTNLPEVDIYGGLLDAFYGPVVLKDIYYEFDSDRLTPRAIQAIEKYLIPFMNDYSDVIISLSAHTDKIGPDIYNLELSQRRAESVVQYLLSRGISIKRLDPRGMGEKHPIAPNVNPDGSDNPEGRALNRRTEIRVIGHINR